MNDAQRARDVLERWEQHSLPRNPHRLVVGSYNQIEEVADDLGDALANRDWQRVRSLTASMERMITHWRTLMRRPPGESGYESD